MRLLILGGTLYLGRHVVDAALAAGHEVTLFHRGRTGAGLFPQVERLIGDREGDLAALRGRRWDAVVDTSGFLPRLVRASVEALADGVGHYVFISSISVYAEDQKSRLVETDAVGPWPDGAEEVLTGETYGPMKARCERVLEETMPGSVAAVRAGMIFGRHDVTDRSPYWPRRMAEGGEVLAPGRPGRPIQLIDVRDIAAWIVRLAERRIAGTFNATGPEPPLTMGRFLAVCAEAARSDARLTWVDQDFLAAAGVQAFNELPLWVPESYHRFQDVDVSKAMAAGLTYRPLRQTIDDVLAEARPRPAGPIEVRPGITMPPSLARAREAELLEQWRTQGSRVHEAASRTEPASRRAT